MKEYIVREHHDFPYEEPKPQELIRCKECEGYEEGRCHWWYDDPEVPSDGYCHQAERKEE